MDVHVYERLSPFVTSCLHEKEGILRQDELDVYVNLLKNGKGNGTT